MPMHTKNNHKEPHKSKSLVISQCTPVGLASEQAQASSQSLGYSKQPEPENLAENTRNNQVRENLGVFWHWDHHGFSWLGLNRRKTQEPFGFAAHPTPPARHNQWHQCHPRADSGRHSAFPSNCKNKRVGEKPKGSSTAPAFHHVSAIPPQKSGLC